MKDFLARFRFGDFAAYFLPGLVMLAAIAWLLTFTAFDGFVDRVFRETTLTTGLMLACVAYALGAFISGSSASLFPHAYRITRRKPYSDARTSIQPPEVEMLARGAFIEVFGPDCPIAPWSECQFYLARAAVNERMPYATAEAVRQNDLMRLRENMLLPVLTLYSAAMASAFVGGQSNARFRWSMVIASTLVTYWAVGRLVGRAADNRRREVREIYSALLVGCRLQVFTGPPNASGRPIPPGPKDDSVAL